MTHLEARHRVDDEPDAQRPVARERLRRVGAKMLDDTLGDIAADRAAGTHGYPEGLRSELHDGGLQLTTPAARGGDGGRLGCIPSCCATARTSTRASWASGMTPLQMAMLNGVSGRALLCAAGADVNAQMSPGRSGLVMSGEVRAAADTSHLLRHGSEFPHSSREGAEFTAARLDDPALPVGPRLFAAGWPMLGRSCSRARAAGSYKAYLRALRLPLVALRRLCARGVPAPHTRIAREGVLRRLFPSPPPAQPAKKRTRSAALVESTTRKLPTRSSRRVLVHPSDRRDGRPHDDEAHEQARATDSDCGVTMSQHCPYTPRPHPLRKGDRPRRILQPPPVGARQSVVGRDRLGRVPKTAPRSMPRNASSPRAASMLVRAPLIHSP